MNSANCTVSPDSPLTNIIRLSVILCILSVSVEEINRWSKVGQVVLQYFYFFLSIIHVEKDKFSLCCRLSYLVSWTIYSLPMKCLMLQERNPFPEFQLKIPCCLLLVLSHQWKSKTKMRFRWNKLELSTFIYKINPIFNIKRLIYSKRQKKLYIHLNTNFLT